MSTNDPTYKKISEENLSENNTEALLNEAKIDAADVDSFIKSSLYKTLERNCMQMLRKVEDADSYGDKRKGDPRKFVEDELEDLEYAVNFMDSLAVANYPAGTYSALSKLLRSAESGVSRARKILSTIPDEEILTRFKSLDYTKRALNAFKDVFKILNVPWTLDYNWQNYLNDSDPAKRKDNSTKDAQGRRIIDYAVPEERKRELRDKVQQAFESDQRYKNFCSENTLSEAELRFVRGLYIYASHKRRE